MKTGKASQTAENNAFLRASESLKPKNNRICYDPYAKYFLNPVLWTIYQIPFLRMSLISAWEYTLPGISLSILARTRYFDEFLTTRLSEIGQVVILGAGYDTRAYRLFAPDAKFRVFEVDNPNTQRKKTAKIRMVFGKNKPSHVTYVPIDFNCDSLSDALFRCGFDNRQKTVFIWEGVTYYISEAAVTDTLNFISSRCPKESDVIFDYFPPWVARGDKKRQDAKRLSASLHFMGEKIIWGLEPENMKDFLFRYGLCLQENTSVKDLAKDYLSHEYPGLNLTDFFFIARAKVG